MWNVSIAHGLTSTDLSFSNDEEAKLRRRGITASLERRLGERWAVQVGGGASLGGDVTISGERYDFAPGWLASLGGTFRILEGEGLEPFLLAGLTAAVSSTQAERPGEEAMFTAVDARGSITVGKLFWGGIAPYALARVFGGPVFWERGGEEITGSDDHHFQLGAGLLATAAGRVSAFAEIVPLGERSASFGASVAF
ncbi:MAG: hypothetical protein JRI23_13530 [Deltaproteobacteria bacterium]|nr:hypothetical protein [Deltaproteobacteria bacterium]MBW2532749.1 hypothetical protein [Deltaproteobacteria bacterium]